METHDCFKSSPLSFGGSRVLSPTLEWNIAPNNGIFWRTCQMASKVDLDQKQISLKHFLPKRSRVLSWFAVTRSKLWPCLNQLQTLWPRAWYLISIYIKRGERSSYATGLLGISRRQCSDGTGCRARRMRLPRICGGRRRRVDRGPSGAPGGHVGLLPF